MPIVLIFMVIMCRTGFVSFAEHVRKAYGFAILIQFNIAKNVREIITYVILIVRRPHSFDTETLQDTYIKS